MNKYFVQLDNDEIKGWYNSAVNSDIPNDAVEIDIVKAQSAIELYATHYIDGEFSRVERVIGTEEQRSVFKREREQMVAKLTVTYESMIFDADEVSQNRMLRPIAALKNDTDTWLWVLTDNSVVYLTRPQFIAVLTLAGTAQTAVWVQ